MQALPACLQLSTIIRGKRSLLFMKHGQLQNVNALHGGSPACSALLYS